MNKLPLSFIRIHEPLFARVSAFPYSSASTLEFHWNKLIKLNTSETRLIKPKSSHFVTSVRCQSVLLLKQKKHMYSFYPKRQVLFLYFSTSIDNDMESFTRQFSFSQPLSSPILLLFWLRVCKFSEYALVWERECVYLRIFLDFFFQCCLPSVWVGVRILFLNRIQCSIVTTEKEV